MIDKYLEIKLDNGQYQISDNTQTAFLQNKFKLGELYQYTATFSSFRTNDGQFVYGNGTPVFFYARRPNENMLFISNPSETEVCIVTETNRYEIPTTSSMTDSGVWDMIAVWGCDKETADNLDVYVFVNRTPTEGYCGLQCRDANGQLVFDSSNKPLKIIEAQTLTESAQNGYVDQIAWSTNLFVPRDAEYGNSTIGFFCSVRCLAGAGSGAKANASIPIFRLSKNTFKSRLTKFANVNYQGAYASGILPSLYGKPWFYRAIGIQPHDLNSYVTMYTIIDVTNY